ncbi:mobilome CxxCx(11)CxxC protein [Escherichia coli]|uniref:mobilome CxxCx(11)CxxC protein n=1 Tax=Escherichia coli TaxID=562 RepID=UPI003D2EBB51
MPAFEWVHVQLHQQKGMISLSPPTICNSAEFISYGTSRIFDRRMRSLDWKRKVVTFLGVFVPLMIGCAVLSFGLEAPFLPLCITIAGVASIMQLGFSLWSLVSGWDRSYSDCMASVKENTAIYNLAG